MNVDNIWVGFSSAIRKKERNRHKNKERQTRRWRKWKNEWYYVIVNRSMWAFFIYINSYVFHFLLAIHVNDYVFECNNRILNLIQIELSACLLDIYFFGPRQSSDKKNYGSVGKNEWENLLNKLSMAMV